MILIYLARIVNPDLSRDIHFTDYFCYHQEKPKGSPNKMEISQGVISPIPAKAVEDLQATVAQLQAELASLQQAKSTPLHIRSISNTFHALLTSRKFLVLVVDTIVSLLLYYNAADPVLIGILQPVFLTMIGGIAYEDAAEKSAPRNVQVMQDIHPTSD